MSILDPETWRKMFVGDPKILDPRNVAKIANIGGPGSDAFFMGGRAQGKSHALSAFTWPGEKVVPTDKIGASTITADKISTTLHVTPGRFTTGFPLSLHDAEDFDLASTPEARNSQSRVTHFSETEDALQLSEMVIELESVFAGQPRERVAKWIEAETFTENGLRLGTDGILETEWYVPSHLILDVNDARLRFLLKEYREEGDDTPWRLIRVTLSQLFDAFPETAHQLDAFVMRESDLAIDQIWVLDAELRTKMAGKPQIISLFNEELLRGRKARLALGLDKEAEAQDAFYQRQDDFGTF